MIVLSAWALGILNSHRKFFVSYVAPVVWNVAIIGTLVFFGGRLELDDPVDMAASQQVLLDHGVWLRPFGRLLYTMPPFVSTDDDVRAITEAMCAVVAATPVP